MAPFDLDRPLIAFDSSAGGFDWTIRRAVEGVQIFGGIGSGKTSGSGRMIALKYLKEGFGGLVLTVKPDEKQSWVEYCELTNRKNDLIILEPGGLHSFNFMEYESSHGELSLTENIVEVLKTVIRAGNTKDTGKSDDAFWETALDLLIFNIIDLCMLAYGTVTVKKMYEIAITIPKALTELKGNDGKAFSLALEEAKGRVSIKIDKWENELSDVKKRQLSDDAHAYEEAMVIAVPEANLLRLVDQFFADNFIGLSEKTRSIIDFSFIGFLFRLLREPIYSLFADRKSTFSPEDCLEGKIILINIPVKTYNKVGRDCQILFKYIWQRAMERRKMDDIKRPVFLWADEAQNFLHEHDASYQATARSSRIATVYISQNLPNYFASMGGANPDNRVKSFLGTLATKIFHANADIETNKYASELVGHQYYINEQESDTYGNQFSKGKSKSLILEATMRPEEFIKLKTGGPKNRFMVEGLLHCQGDSLIGTMNHSKVSFKQTYI
jgi:hypothetical protein